MKYVQKPYDPSHVDLTPLASFWLGVACGLAMAVMAIAGWWLGAAFFHAIQ